MDTLLTRLPAHYIQPRQHTGLFNSWLIYEHTQTETAARCIPLWLAVRERRKHRPAECSEHWKRIPHSVFTLDYHDLVGTAL